MASRLGEEIAGYVTSGNYSLNRGNGFGIGFLALARILAARMTDQDGQAVQPNMVGFKNPSSDVVRMARYEILH